MEKAAECKTSARLCFIDPTKAYNSVDCVAMVDILSSHGLPQQLVEVVEDLYARTWCHVKTLDGPSQNFEVKSGGGQGCVLSPVLCNSLMDEILKEVA